MAFVNKGYQSPSYFSVCGKQHLFLIIMLSQENSFFFLLLTCYFIITKSVCGVNVLFCHLGTIHIVLL